MTDWKREVRRRLQNLRLDPTHEAAIVEELAQHLDDCYAELLASGAAETEAREQALAELSGSEILERELRRIAREAASETVTLGYERRGNMIADLWQDLRYGARMLVRKPGFTIVVVITLALGIGANTAIFSVVNAVLLRPLPYEEPDRIVLIRETKLPQFPEFAVSPANFLDWRDQNTLFERLVAMHPAALNLTGAGDPERLRGLSVTEGFFALLGVEPRIGRDFSPAEHLPGNERVAILSHGLWQRRFGGDPGIINRSISLDGRNYTVIGVMPSTFNFMDRSTELWTPKAFTARQAQNRGGHNLSRVIGRLKPGVTIKQARAEMTAIVERLAAEHPINAGWGVMLLPLEEYTVRSIKPALILLVAAVAFVLLIACVNVANLLLSRAAGRQKEMGIRSALGAGRMRIIRQLLAESVMLSLLGGAAGLILAVWGTKLLLALAPQSLPRISDVSFDGRVLAFSAIVALLAGALFGLVPALQLSRPNLIGTLKEAGRGASEGGRSQSLRGALVVLEVAAALLLLVGAGLMIKSFWRLQQVDPGFAAENALTVSVSLPPRKYPAENQQLAFFEQLLERTGSLPGVEAVGATSLLPLSDDDFVLGFEVEDRPPLAPGAGEQSTNFFSVSPDYFKAMGIPLLRGRLFTERETRDAPHVALINETMAKRIFPGEDPIGKRITFDPRDRNPDWYEIVGIVGDVKHYGLDQATSLQTYEPYTQQTFPYMTLVVRASGDPGSLGNLSAAIRREVLSIDKEQPVSSILTLESLVTTSVAQRRFSMLLLGVFATVALSLCAVGIYGVLNYAVSQRTHEIGIRMALGARPGEVLRLVIGRGMALALLGVAIGLGAALALTRAMSTLLFGVSATDPVTFAGVALGVVGVALTACYIPARRAMRVDPLVALRCE